MTQKHYIPFNLFWNRKLKFEELWQFSWVHSRTCWLCPKHDSWIIWTNDKWQVYCACGLWISWNCTIIILIPNSLGSSSNMARSLEKNHQESSETVSTLAFPLADLPDLVLVNVANQLSNDDARNLSLTCMRFQVIKLST